MEEAVAEGAETAQTRGRNSQISGEVPRNSPDKQDQEPDLQARHFSERLDRLERFQGQAEHVHASKLAKS